MQRWLEKQRANKMVIRSRLDAETQLEQASRSRQEEPVTTARNNRRYCYRGNVCRRVGRSVGHHVVSGELEGIPYILSSCQYKRVHRRGGGFNVIAVRVNKTQLI
ncbi:hypothetical protein Baya_12483 [Bagarius yarrelli]|uniref:Uncharacterized protein n=1 Tax=Bagarius yarrelli TaxID=175774 RepID=A0A556V8R5_BAGYA|nr:hypothetical protein Baya_12483 [Bagarius yarrelli]